MHRAWDEGLGRGLGPHKHEKNEEEECITKEESEEA